MAQWLEGQLRHTRGIDPRDAESFILYFNPGLHYVKYVYNDAEIFARLGLQAYVAILMKFGTLKSSLKATFNRILNLWLSNFSKQCIVKFHCHY